MKLAYTLTSFLDLVSLVTDSPASGQGLRLPLERRNNTVSMESLPAHLPKVSTKYRRRFAASEMTKRDAGDVPLTVVLDAEQSAWYASIDVGSPRLRRLSQVHMCYLPFEVAFDTGSAPNVLHPKDMIHPALRQLSNLTHHSTGVMGNLIADNITIGAVICYPQTSGLPLFETLVKGGQLPENRFGVKLSTIPGASELYVGGTNTVQYQQDTLTWSPVTEAGYWEAILDVFARWRSGGGLGGGGAMHH
ncbi:hypothetical protein EDB19DRAFT_1906680 [Suillus lakei]|nr:hypothetical protein EDB19DRAFT_1906680 [Suillus lakei]